MINITRQTRIKAALKGYSHNITQPPSSYKILISREPVQFQMMAMTALGYLIAWGPFAALCMWEMVTKPRVSGETSLTSPLVSMKTIIVMRKVYQSIQTTNVLGHSRDLSGGGLPVCQVCHCLQSLHLLLHVQGLQKRHRDCV